MYRWPHRRLEVDQFDHLSCKAMAFTPRLGDRIWKKYRAYPTWHERLVCAKVVDQDFVIVTPDFDVYIEQMDAAKIKSCFAKSSQQLERWAQLHVS